MTLVRSCWYTQLIREGRGQPCLQCALFGVKDTTGIREKSMGRTVLLEERLRSEFEKLTSTRQTHVGMLVGQFTTSKDYVSLFVRTPLLQEIQKENVECSVLGQEQVVVPDWWLLEHARQVSALLCGGLSIVGVAVWCSTDQFKLYQLKLRQSLVTMATTQDHCYRGNYILLHHPTNSKKSICQTLHPSDTKGGFRPAEFKYTPHFSQWTRLESYLQLNRTLTCSSSVETKEETLNDLLKPFFELVSDALLTVQGRLVADDEADVLLVKSKKSSQTPPQSQAIKMEWLSKLYASETGVPELLTGTRRIAMDGCLSLVALVPQKATLKDAVNAMKQDARRSLSARVNALVEANANGGRLCYERERLPCRVSLSLPHIPMELYEYMLPGESVEDCVGRVCELTGCLATDVSSAVLEQSVAPPINSSLPSTPEVVAMDTVDGAVVKRYTGLISILATVGVALLAFTVWLVLKYTEDSI